MLKCSSILVVYMITFALSTANSNYYSKLLIAKLGSVMQINLMEKVLNYAIIRNSFYKVGDILNLV